MISREQAREQINSLDLKDLYPFQRAKKSGYICPICGDGSGKTGTGLSLKAGKRTRCYKSGCFSDMGEDNVGALRIILSHDKGREVTENEVFSMVLGGNWEHIKPEGITEDSSLQAKKKQEKPRQDDKTRAKIKAFCMEAAKKLQSSEKALEYLRKERGFTDNIIKHFCLGYDSVNDALVIPYDTSFSYYVTRPFSSENGMKYKNPSADFVKASEPLYNAAVISSGNDKPVFVVEAPLCAISIKQACSDASAVALCGVKKNDKLINLIEAKKAYNAVYILCLDNDLSEVDENGNEKGRAGQQATEKLSQAMKEKNIKHIVYNIAGDCKDPNELLAKDPEALAVNIGKALEKAEEEKQREKFDYIRQNSNKAFTLGFIADVLSNPQIPYISSGFASLDEMLEGGFYPGLYVLGAESSVGKSTFALQIADNIAAQGTDIIYFSFEMSKKSLTAKSISRETFIRVNKKGLLYNNAKTSKGISDGSKYQNYSNIELEIIKTAESNYLKYADKVYIVEASGKAGTDFIRQKIEEHIKLTGNKPFVVIDYMQLLATFSGNASDKQAVDMVIADLKEISRDNDIIVLTISSFNRKNYGDTAKMQSFKESGNIEYTGDCILGLEYKDLENGKKFDDIVKQAYKDAREKESRPVSIRVKLLKQREGGRGGDAIFNYYMPFNYFIPEGEEIPKEKDEQTGFTIADDNEIDVPF